MYSDDNQTPINRISDQRTHSNLAEYLESVNHDVITDHLQRDKLDVRGL